MYSVFMDVLASNCCLCWSGLTCTGAPWGNSPMGAGKTGIKLKPAVGNKKIKISMLKF